MNPRLILRASRPAHPVLTKPLILVRHRVRPGRTSVPFVPPKVAHILCALGRCASALRSVVFCCANHVPAALRPAAAVGALFCTLPADLSAIEHPDLIYAFTSYTRPEPMKMILVGEIRSKTKAPEVHEKESPVRGYDTRSDIVTIKVANREGLKPGQKLYVIEKNPFHRQHRDGLIVGEITVSSIFFSPFYGWALTGKGILLRVREGHFVARTLESENLERAFVLKRKGDHFRGTGDTEKAIQAYSDAIGADPWLPDAHAALGAVYFDEGRARGEYPVRALAEYEQAWKSRANFRYRLEEHRYYLDFMTALHGAYSVRRFEKGREANLVQLIDRIVEVGKVARDLSPDPDTLLHLTRAYYVQMEYYRGQASPSDRAKYDTAFRHAGESLKKLFENTVSDPEAHRIAALYYAQLHAAMKAPSELESREKLKKLVSYHADSYDRLYRGDKARDPRVDQARIQVGGR